MSDGDRETTEARRKLRALLTEAGLQHDAARGGMRQMVFAGRLREWTVYAGVNPTWFHVHVDVCALPAEAGLRAELLLWMARANAAMSLLKYSVTTHDRIVLEGEARFERLDAADVNGLVWFVETTAEQDYVAVLRIARGEARLDALSDAFVREPASGEGSVSP